LQICSLWRLHWYFHLVLLRLLVTHVRLHANILLRLPCPVRHVSLVSLVLCFAPYVVKITSSYCDIEDCLIFPPFGFFGWKLTV
jgi:hypothetical protein